MENPSKTTHLGTLLRCAAAFQCHQVLLVGYDKFNAQGSFGSHLFLDIVVFPTWDSVYDYLKNGGGENINYNSVDQGDANGECSNAAGPTVSSTDAAIPINLQSKDNTQHRHPVSIVGILGAYGGGDDIFSSDGILVHEDTASSRSFSIIPPTEDSAATDTNNNPIQKEDTTNCIQHQQQHRSFPIDTRQFATDTCFVLSRDRNMGGLPSSQAQLCNGGFVHVPHLAIDDIDSTASSSSPNITKSNLMDTATTLSIVLHHFTAWAGYEERTFAENQKFVKDIKPQARRRLCRVYVPKTDNENGNEDENDVLFNPMLMWNAETEDAAKGSDY